MPIYTQFTILFCTFKTSVSFLNFNMYVLVHGIKHRYTFFLILEFQYVWSFGIPATIKLRLIEWNDIIIPLEITE